MESKRTVDINALLKKKLKVVSDEKALRNMLELVRLHKHKLQVENLQLKSMIGALIMNQTKSVSASSSQRFEPYHLHPEKDVNEKADDVNQQGKDVQNNQEEVINQQGTDVHNQEVINQQEIELNVTDTLNNMLAGTFFNNDSEEEEEEEKEEVFGTNEREEKKDILKDVDDTSDEDSNSTAIKSSTANPRKRKKFDSSVDVMSSIFDFLE